MSDWLGVLSDEFLGFFCVFIDLLFFDLWIYIVGSFGDKL